MEVTIFLSTWVYASYMYYVGVGGGVVILVKAFLYVRTKKKLKEGDIVEINDENHFHLN